MDVVNPSRVAAVPTFPPAQKTTQPQQQQTHRARASDLLLAWADRRRYWLFAAVIVVYLAGFNAQWRLEPDSALYLSIGRNLAEGQGYTFHGTPHRLAYPGLPLIIPGIF